MGINPKPNLPSKRRVPNVRHFKKDKYHPDCYTSQEEAQAKEVNEKGKKNQSSGLEKMKVPLVSHDLIRNIIVPGCDPKTKKAIFDKESFERLKFKSKFLTPEERLKLAAEAKAEKERKAMESALRKKELQDCDKIIEYGAKLSEVEEEAARKAQHLLARAHELRQEQEDEIKKCNALILATKCHAIRDAQVAEKKLIEKELSEEEKRMEDMMEQERQQALRQQEREKEQQKIRKQQYVKTVLEQIQENELQREMQAERIEEESRLANEAAMQVQLDELKSMKQKMAEQAQQREEMNKINQQLHHFACLEKEENRLADLKVQEYMRRKAEAEAARQRELAKQRLEKEKELARLRAMQKRAADTQAAKDEMNAMRIQDELIEHHRMELLKQIGEKEKDRIKARQQLFEEGLAIKVEKQKRDEMLKETMIKKMNMIRSHQVPEKYVREVERQLQLTG
uniref:Cilia- and flagella-associated protein 45 n=1 Tax=Homalodisca liturata TaxID=320908 RepID=A0A1B6I1U4_9HEMI